VGINLLREGLDIPEVSLVVILDADKEGFLRSERSLIQTIGRAARNENGRVIMYGDSITDSMRAAIDETNRRRGIQQKYNEENGIVPRTIKKEIREAIHSRETHEMALKYMSRKMKKSGTQQQELLARLEKEMREAARILDFERAAELRDMILEIKSAD
ncbi:MAG: UvrB/UvrC motif-containing protein, partial [Erysipelotrichaceae bacterium]|nr:UvrB/UvrC motif-containing protein [Erysipelotrichaceae bacterium]